MGKIMSFKSIILLLLNAPIIMTWTDYQTVNILAYTRMRSNGSVDQGVVVLVNDATFAYFDQTDKTFVLRPSASTGFSVLEDNDRSFCMKEVLRGFYRQQEYLSKLKEHTDVVTPPFVSPSVNVYAQFSVAEGQANVLYCFATGFYPGDIEITFFLNGRLSAAGLTSDLTYGDNWTFRVYKYMAISPQLGDEYACQVKHSSMAKPKVSVWRPEFPAPTMGSFWIFGLASGIICGTIISGFLVRRFILL